MGDIMNIGSIHEYNEFLGIETLNPLVAVIDFRRVRVLRHKKKLYGFLRHLPERQDTRGEPDLRAQPV